MNSYQGHNKPLKRLISGAFFVLILGAVAFQQAGFLGNITTSVSPLSELEASRAESTWVEFNAVVVKTLSDDLRGDRHQRFIVNSGQLSLLIAHNIDLAAKVPLKTGDEVSIRGQYEWNDQGGVVHWTHHDPQQRVDGGWIEWNGKKFK